MQKQSKISQYLKSSSQGRQIFQSQELQIESFENKAIGQDKKQPNLINFLKKIDQHALQIMEKYLFEYKHLLEMPVKPKISLYEDIMIIYQFRNAFDNLMKNRTKTVQSLCQKLQPILKRSKITIKERVSKKLTKCTIEEIIQAIKNRRDLMIEKNKKNHHSSNEEGDQIKSEQKVKQQRRMENVPQNIKKEVQPKPMPQVKNKQNTVTNHILGSQYKYGSKPIKQRVYIYANRISRQMINFSQSRFNQMKEKHNIQASIKPNHIEQAMVIEVSSEPKMAQESRQADKTNIQAQGKEISSMNEEQLRNYIAFMTEKANEVLNKKESNHQQFELLQKRLEQISQLSKGLKRRQDTRVKENEEDASSDISGQKSEERLSKEVNSTGKKTYSSPSKQVSQDQMYRKMFEQVNKNPKYLELISNNNELKQQYMWEKQQDDLLYNFKFNSEAYRTEMMCLLRYKSREVILERMKYLKIDINFNLIEQVNKLQNKPTETVVPQQEIMMDVE